MGEEDQYVGARSARKRNEGQGTGLRPGVLFAALIIIMIKTS
jgi:hypothetical protein